MTKLDTSNEYASAQTSGGEGGHDDATETRTGCGVVHQYDGNELCQSGCTLDFGHDGPHACSNGHYF